MIEFLTKHSKELRVEREAERRYNLSSSELRIKNGPQAMPRWSEAKALINRAMASRELVAFHATRLFDFQEVRRGGLLKLNLAQQIARLKRHLEAVGANEELAEVDVAVRKMLETDSFFIKREGAVWATPHRASLHDGGCAVFYESCGGEALERIATNAGGKLEQKLKQLGKPAVVIIRYPALGWCAFTNDRLPRSMIELHLQHQGNWEAPDYG
ncbi:hypothetical protein ACUXV3_16645 [Roseobacteraceae bacterium NS-SX3]